VPNYNLPYKKCSLLLALGMMVNTGTADASEKNRPSSSSDSSKILTKPAPLDEEFLLFLASFDEQQGDAIDPLDMLSMEDEKETSVIKVDAKKPNDEEAIKPGESSTEDPLSNTNQPKENK
jgi:hypothetical protein